MRYYVDPSVSPGDSVHIGSTSCSTYPHHELTQIITSIDCASHGDYVGSDVEMSNRRVLVADEDCAPHLIHLLGSHGYQGLAYIGETMPAPLAERLAGLDDYPLIDDDDHSALQFELAEEAWKSGGRQDFRAELEKLADRFDGRWSHDGDKLTDERVDEIWHEAESGYNINGGQAHIIETGGVVHFYLAEIMANIERAAGHFAKLWRTMRSDKV